MSMIYGLFDAVNTGSAESPVYDRSVDSDFLASMYRLISESGVGADSFAVTPSSGLTVSVSSGSALILGRHCYDTSAATLTLSAVSTSRTDLIVLRLDLTARTITLAVAEDATTPTRAGDVYELVLAAIEMPSATTEITAAMITDKRADATVCGSAGARLASITDADKLDGQHGSYYLDYNNATNKPTIPHITAGTSAPTGGNNGDIYLQYSNS